MFCAPTTRSTDRTSAWLEDSAYSIVPAAGTSFSFDENGILNPASWFRTVGFRTGPTTGPVADRRRAHADRIDGTSRRTASEDHGLCLHAEFDATEHLSFSGDVQYVEATADNFDYTLNTQVNPSSLSVDLTGNLPSVSATPGGYLEERDNFFWAAGMDDTQQNEATQFATRLSMAFNIDSGWFQTFKAGVRYTDARPPIAIPATTGSPSASGGRAMRKATGPGTSRAWTATSPINPRSSIFRTSSAAANLPGSLWVASDSLVKNLKKTAASCSRPGSTERAGRRTRSRPATPTRSRRRHTPHSLAALWQGTGIEDLDGNVGVRVVRPTTRRRAAPGSRTGRSTAAQRQRRPGLRRQVGYGRVVA